MSSLRNLNEDSPSSSDEFALLVDAVQDYAIFLLSLDGEIRSWNRGASRVFGYAADQVIGKNFSQFYPEADAAKPKRELEVATSEGRVEDEGWRLRGDGTRFWANTIITALHDAGGKVTGFAKITRDLTERRNSEERLRESEEMFRLLVQSVRDYAIFVLDPNGIVTTWNAGARRIKGYEAHEIIGRHFSTFYPEEDVRAGKPEKELVIARQVGAVEDEGWRVRKDGSRFWANVVITAIYASDGTLRGFAKVTRDITERKQAEEVRQSLLEQREARLVAEEQTRRAESSYLAAQEANKAKDDFLMTLSHELRTPMTSVLGWARLLPTMDPSDPMFKDAIAAIGRSAELQTHLIDDVLDVSRIVSGKLRLTREIVRVEQVLRDAIDAVRTSADARNITIATAFDPNVATIIADATRLQQIVWNLLTNAVKFSSKQSTIEVSAKRDNNHVVITVKDNGEGIEAGFLPHVFEPFRQAESPRTRVHGGLGLGLSIVKYLVDAHGGTVRAESPGRGKGATFTVTLPVDAKADKSGEHTSKPPAKETISDRLSGLKILVVDDDRETREFIRVVLRQAGAEITAVESAHAAVQSFEQEKPHVVVTDIAMPGMDGYELTRMLRSRAEAKGVKIIALTAFPGGIANASQAGLDMYLTKPIDPADLVQALADVAGRER